MSYILDALKKSDKQRQQDHVPDLNTVQVELPAGKRKKASWHLPLAAIVLVNVIFILFYILRQDQPSLETQAVALDTARPQPATIEERQSTLSPQVTPGPSPVIEEPLPTDPVASVDNNPVVSVAVEDNTLRQAPAAAPSMDQIRNTKNIENNIPSGITVAEEDVETVAALEEAGQADITEEIVPEAPSKIIPPPANVAIATEVESEEASFPFEEQSETPEQDLSPQPLVAAPADSIPVPPKPSLVNKALSFYQLPESIQQQLPELHIDAHLFYKDKPASRFASINGKILREGHILAPGLKVAEISNDGVIFRYQKYLFHVPVF